MVEHLEHPGVVGQYRRNESTNPTLTCRLRDVLEEDRPQTTTLVVVPDDEGDLGFAWCGPFVPDDADDLLVHCGDQRHPVVVIDVR